MNLKDIIKSRYSVRSFTKKNVDIEIIKEILQISTCAPSGGNIQPWKVYVVTGNAKEKLIERALSNYDNGVQEKIEYEIYPNPLDEEYKKRRSECAKDMYAALSIEQDDIESRLTQIRENFKFFGAPVGMIITIDKAFAVNGWGHVGMFIQNICLSAIDNDMGTCLQESWSIYPETVKDALNIPENEVVWCGIALGYPNPKHPINNYRTSRESIDKFVTFIK
ncbi:MAG: nitroreductase [Proteobacteria bacterium]|nr:nitroreductase [Pseudomonadota bacterium]MDA0976171.1 nitroreductase [Pseudomonadota bacterium]MDA1036770.1 nitroreductase [Pseudomonadota bacterium]